MRILPFVYWRLVILAALSCGQVNRSANAQSSGPTILQVIPAPGFVEELSSITVFFSQSVTGVLPVDFLVNGVPATSVTGAGARYTFQFAQPPYGPVEISWGTLHTIFNLNNPPQRFDGGLAGATWAYQLSNPAGPTLLSEIPVPGTVLNRLSEVEVRFDQPVTGVDASDLKLNGIAATSLSGTGAGPYRFIFAQVPAGQALLEWIPAHGIATDEPIPHAFKGATWRYTVDPLKPIPAVIINEILAENQTGLLDEDKDPEDWIELYNGGEQPVNLEGWSLSVDREDEGQWVFPSVNLPARGYLLVWASGKDRSGPPLYRSLHTNFKLNPNGDTLRLSPRTILTADKSTPQASPGGISRPPPQLKQIRSARSLAASKPFTSRSNEAFSMRPLPLVWRARRRTRKFGIRSMVALRRPPTVRCICPLFPSPTRVLFERALLLPTGCQPGSQPTPTC